MENIFRGCGTALVTPFKEDGSVDYEAYAALVDRQVEGGVDFLTALATTAETPTLSPEEKKEILRLTHEHCGGKPVLVGCGSNSVEGTLSNMRLLDCDAVSGWLVVVPFYNKPTQEGLYLYFKAIAAATSKPVVLYNVPGRTGMNMTAGTCLRAGADVDNIVAVKEASGNLSQVVEILRGAPAGFEVLSGDDDMTLDMMKEGAAGVISVASNIAPAEVSAMVRAAEKGGYSEAEAINEGLMPLFKACFVESNPVPAKAALSLLGLCSDVMRLPLTAATEATRETIGAAISGIPQIRTGQY